MRIAPIASLPAALDLGERVGGDLGAAVRDQPGRLRLHDDARDVVRDDVVQLTRDRDPLVLPGADRLTAASLVEVADVRTHADRHGQTGERQQR